jgi:tRNA threonylcarbamoyladenosine biosynthesis protein TsaE
MSPGHRVLWTTHSGEETEALGASQFANLIPPGAPCVVIELRGELGTGKSTFARGVLRALGAKGSIKSPSYTLVETYELPGIQVLHIDLYRLNDPDELEHLGLVDFYKPGFLWLIEWPERAQGRLPQANGRFDFSIVDGGHRIERIETFKPTK